MYVRALYIQFAVWVHGIDNIEQYNMHTNFSCIISGDLDGKRRPGAGDEAALSTDMTRLLYMHYNDLF